MVQSDSSSIDGNITTDKTSCFAQCFERGLALSTHDRNYEYAHAMFSECVLHDPGNLKFVEAMLRNLRALAPKPKRRIFRLPSGGNYRLKKSLQEQRWADVLREGVDRLKVDPWEVATLCGMATACAALHHNEVELAYLKQALDADPKSLEVNRHCARSLGRMGQFDQAIACWHRVETLRGKDDEATKMISMLAAEKLRYPGGRPPKIDSKPVVTEKPQSETTPVQDLVLSPQQVLEQAISQNPKQVDNYIELVELLIAGNKLKGAETVLNRGITACGEQTCLKELAERIQLLRTEEMNRLTEEVSQHDAESLPPLRVPWLELALGGTFVALILQLVPAAGAVAWKIANVNEWSRGAWFLFNCFVLLALLAIRYAPELRSMRRKPQKKYTAR